jgi:PUA domain protein
MFQKFTKEDINGQTQTKSSVTRNIKGTLILTAKLVSQYPSIEAIIDDLIPKKSPLFLVKCLDRVTLVQVNDQYLFFQHFDGDFFPTLKLLHKYPNMLPKVGVDRGAIKFVLKGAEIMCPGMTSQGGDLSTDIENEKVVAVYAEGKEHAIAVGLTKMSTEEIKSVNKGVGVENIHQLADGLWKLL